MLHSVSKIPKSQIIHILNEYGYFATGIFEDNFEEYKHSDGHILYLSDYYLDCEKYALPYDYKFNGCERGVRAYILGINNQ